MKKKSNPAADAVIAPQILEMARKSIEADRPAVLKVCAVCGSKCTPVTGPQVSEDLCWVCRRLKISAWRDSDQQVSAQE